MKFQILPIALTVLTFIGLTFLLYAFLHFLNLLPLQSKLILMLRPVDILVGLTIYVKTAIDFALFMGILMHRHPGIKNRIAIELGTAIGNGVGTLVILSIWIFFKEIPLLLILMMVVAALVLLRMAEDSLEEFLILNFKFLIVKRYVKVVKTVLHIINGFSDPLLGKLLPRYSPQDRLHQTFSSLFLFALTIPFLLGLDDFAGYIPLFSLINVFGFATGVFLGHMLLTASLFAFPEKTARFVRQPTVLVLGGMVFLGLSLLGIIEAGQMAIRLLH